MNVKLIVEYEGTRYHGWQSQAGTPTIESALRAAITELTGETPALTAAGRTDAGVHALGQVVNFKLEKPFAIDQLPGALNARLASDISVRCAELVDDSFNARYSARARHYAYRIRQALPRGAYQRQYAWCATCWILTRCGRPASVWSGSMISRLLAAAPDPVATRFAESKR
jgi:tRNA pseudouridine38-40 synthase